MVDRGTTVEAGSQIAIAPWRSNVNTFEDKYFEREERWVQFFGVPYHLWSMENSTKIGDKLGGVVAMDTCAINMKKIGGAKIKIKIKEPQTHFKPMLISDGLKKI